eukprot:CAMPEP_0116994852 /NCGR_PEP_ID=MMETSP0467-20121206/68394_1 /TAXON_ID=283647 /ORGANISM="Mesodinium pulex, Strain SPMC105" /LENGTH=67 /DNA_ID=CAMNT_0004693033 /DNA_START=426 /DNA_END=625 /DNA_ORIENTATION=-
MEGFTNNPPFWNVDVLKLSNRIKESSIKNFQFVQEDEVILQFGKYSEVEYALDFREPFNLLETFCLA